MRKGITVIEVLAIVLIIAVVAAFGIAMFGNK